MGNHFCFVSVLCHFPEKFQDLTLDLHIERYRLENIVSGYDRYYSKSSENVNRYGLAGSTIIRNHTFKAANERYNYIT